MKIYFEDGELRKMNQLSFKPDTVINAASGVTACENLFKDLRERHDESVVYTNSIIGFSNRYAWNDDLKVPEIYIRTGEHMTFTRIDKLTEREIRQAHNLGHMYMNGVFSDR